jgi:hypothetical protein
VTSQHTNSTGIDLFACDVLASPGAHDGQPCRGLNGLGVTGPQDAYCGNPQTVREIQRLFQIAYDAE